MTLDTLLGFDPKADTCFIRCSAAATHSESGLILYPDNARPWQPIGNVLKLGPYKHDPGFGVGDTVLISRPTGHQYDLEDGSMVAQCRNEQVLCLVED